MTSPGLTRSTRFRRVLLGAALLAAPLLVAGCGGDDHAPVAPASASGATALDEAPVDLWSLPGAIRPDSTSSDVAAVPEAPASMLVMAPAASASLTAATPVTTVVSLVPQTYIGVGNCYPFGTNVGVIQPNGNGQFMGFIYRNVPAFAMRRGDRLRFDLGSVNEVDIRRTIYFAVANRNPSPSTFQSQDVHATSWTQVVSSAQTPANPRGNLVLGDYELTYVVESDFDFPGGGLVIAFRGSPPDTYRDQGCEQVLHATDNTEPSGRFYGRFYGASDLTLGTLDAANWDRFWLAGFIVERDGVANSAPVASVGGPYVGDEGAPVALSLGATDADNDALTISWNLGDGTAGSGTLPTTHTYADNGTYTITVTATDTHGASSTATTTATIANVAPTVTAGNDAVVERFTTFTLDASFTDPGANDGPWQYQVNWGEGTGGLATSEGDVAAPGAITLSPVLSTPGTHTVTVRVTDKDGGVGTDSLVATVNKREAFVNA